MDDDLVGTLCTAARRRFWRDERARLIGSDHKLFDEVYIRDLEEEMLHALVLVLSRLPSEQRRDFAATFLAERSRGSRADPVAAAAAIVLEVSPLLAGRSDVLTDRVVDLLQGAAQGDDLAATAQPAVDEMQKAIARIRLDVDLEDPSSIEGNVAHAVAEVLDPSGGVVDLKEIVARCSWAAVSAWDPPRVLAFLLKADALLHEEVSDTGTVSDTR